LEDQYLALLASRLEDRKKTLIEFLCDGAAKDYAAYKDLCGEIRGLSAAQAEVKDLVRKFKELDDE